MSSLFSRKLSVESLEHRRVMAGNVNVSVSGGDLMMTGDDLANGIGITQVVNSQGVPVSGAYNITGFFQGGAGTTINGQSAIVVTGVNDDAFINLRGGNDRLATNVGVVRFNDDVNIDLGNGINSLTLNNVVVADDLTINSGRDADTIFVRGRVGDSSNNFDNDLTINTREGLDRVTLLSFTVRDDVNIDTGFGNADDAVNLTIGAVGDDLTVRTRDGSDRVLVDRLGVNDDFLIDTGSGNDRVNLNRVTADELFTFLGSNDDRLDLFTTSGRRAILDGQSGADAIFTSNVAFRELFSANSF